ncbi:alcohol dehydrogenase [Aspergillus uvarum CBS 121591]|uniref:Alcohol dehydrogenase n=1 Tax=Aspergillus uvarum CBS 121591 TaxID=1448315 RepID=A0A319CLE3_9EURO|nr:alcohol dehydrogenase [Aspergillus uvarum CBS 121591]PYH86014.1 alcohol dehydrogenase [Aspergillus uvarum CBS 121591]
MRAVRFYGAGDIRVDQIEEPVCGEGQVKIRPAFVGICGSDLHEYTCGPHLVPLTPHAITGGQLPTTLGHEFSGTVEEVGTGVAGVVANLKVGDRVAVRPNLNDGNCPPCLRGTPNCCRNLGFVGYSSRFDLFPNVCFGYHQAEKFQGNAGGLSDHVVVDAELAIPLPDNIPLDIGALVEPLSVAWHAANRSPLEGARTALVVGGGPIGLAVVQVLLARGVESIIIAEVSSRRREFAKILGATHVLDPRTEDVVSMVRAMTGNAGVDVAFECSGVQAGLDTALRGIRVRGTVTIVSLWEAKPSIDASAIVLDEKHVIGAAIFADGIFPAVIEAISSGKLNPQTMITSKIRMEDIVEKGFEALINEKDKHVKILVDISA